MIARDPRGASGASYDLIVVGAGVYGIAVTHAAARLGLRPLLLEHNDFGGATSSNTLRIIHGGLRSLQTLDLSRLRENLLSQHWFLRHFSEHLAPLECLMPFHGQGLRRPTAFRAALALNEFLAQRWAPGLRDERLLAPGRVLRTAETIRRFPRVPRERLEGAGLWNDVLMLQPQRILMEWLRWACAEGATALNRVGARQLLIEDGRVAGVLGEDGVTGASYEFKAPLLVNCAGPWSQALGREFDKNTPPVFTPSLAFNLVLDRVPLSDCAVAVTAQTGSRRTYFVIPWGPLTLAGTFHDAWTGPPADPQPAPGQIEQMLRELNSAIPAWELEPSDVLRTWAGLLPAANTPSGGERLRTRELIHNHARTGGPAGAITVAGVKFTTAPLVAGRVLRTAGVATRARSFRPTTRPPARIVPDGPAFARTLAAAPHEAADWLRAMVREESVLSIEDLLRRRTDWGLDPRNEVELERLIRTVWPAVVGADHVQRAG